MPKIILKIVSFSPVKDVEFWILSELFTWQNSTITGSSSNWQWFFFFFSFYESFGARFCLTEPQSVARLFCPFPSFVCNKGCKFWERQQHRNTDFPLVVCMWGRWIEKGKGLRFYLNLCWELFVRWRCTDFGPVLPQLFFSLAILQYSPPG